jgi:anti-sigma B factor antagonist
VEDPSGERMIRSVGRGLGRANQESDVKISSRPLDGATVLDLEGPIDGSDTCRAIHEAIRKELDGGHRKFVVNLAGVDWVNSLGVGFLVAAAVSAVKEDAIVKIVGLNPRVGSVLHACGLIPNIWREYPDEGEAVASFQ